MNADDWDEIINDAHKMKEFADALQVVAEMRKYQRLYFDKKTRSQQILIESKRLETRVDYLLSELGFKAH